MFQYPDYYRTVSLKLSEVLNDIGVNERMILKRRRMIMLGETIETSTFRLMGMNTSIYKFGSQSEGSTTLGLKSDVDILDCDNKHNIIQDWGEWQPVRVNLLMIQEEITFPGYCMLQKLRTDAPLPVPISLLDRIPDRDLTIHRDKVLVKNTVFKAVLGAGSVVNGPAESVQGTPGVTDADYVSAFKCKSWPVEAQLWLLRQGIGKWPTEDMKSYCETTGCLVVPVSSKNGQYEEGEWRISTSHAERCLMFNLNITQLRCYILMKMVLKTFINPQCDGVLSSYMCKTVLFWCAQNMHSNNWVQSNILPCLMHCLTVLKNFVREENCPHFIIPDNNLMAGRISPHTKHKILEILQNIIQSDGHALLEISIDNLGTRLHGKINMVDVFQYCPTPAQIYAKISAQVLVHTCSVISTSHKLLLRSEQDGNERMQVRLSEFLLTLKRMYREMGFNSLEESALKLLAPPLSSSLASVIASYDIRNTQSISPVALSWFSVGLNSDVASSSLKLASAFYCVGDMERAEFVLRIVEEKYDLNTVEPACACYEIGKNIRTEYFNECNTGNEELIRHNTAFCVRYLPCEICCIPKELQYEICRSTQEERLERDKVLDCWMDWAVVDSLPYLYFLQYKTYGALQRVADQQHALENLVTSIITESNLTHRETALNILGQCMEQENRHIVALRCYISSLNIRARNNAANFHIRRLFQE